MEQAVNTFRKGLNTDSHPMAQSNDRLTDALNATFVTMNGNEIILLNDMGNRRIDNAFLPSGYLPVGIKEYGGIIYVAAYNPITNKSQIGSFPSPERKINSNDYTTEEFNYDFPTLYDKDFNINFIINDSIIKTLLSNDIVMHAGDKFIVYSDDLIPEELSNYDSFDENGEKDYLNKKYTLALGVLNSQNEFVDITSSLARWKKNNDGIWDIVSSDEFEEKSEDYKFNYGYFIPGTNRETGEDIAGMTLRNEREAKLANTYSYKLVGPLCLKAHLNHIESYTYNMYKEIINDEVYIVIDYYIQYNCPDDIVNIDIITKNGELEELSEKTSKSLKVFNEDTKLYSLTLTKKYKVNVDNNIIECYICAGNKNEYIYDLSEKRTIDLNLLNSGTIELSQFRFYNTVIKEDPDNNSYFTDSKFTLTYGLITYPKPGQEFSKLKASFHKVEAEDTAEDFDIILLDSVNTGINTIEFGVNQETPFEYRTLYKVTLTAEENVLIAKNYYFLSTELFNDCYTTVNNFWIKKDNMYPENIENKLLINLEADVSFTASDKTYNKEFTGEFVYESTEQQKEFPLLKHTLKLDLKASGKIVVKDVDLYPTFINSDIQSFTLNSLTIDDTGCKELYCKDSDGYYSPLEYSNVIKFKKDTRLIGSDYFEINWFDKVTGNFIENDKPLNIFKSISDLGNIEYNTSRYVLGIAYNDHAGSDSGARDDHYLLLDNEINANNSKEGGLFKEHDWLWIDLKKQDVSKTLFLYSDYTDVIGYFDGNAIWGYSFKDWDEGNYVKFSGADEGEGTAAGDFFHFNLRTPPQGEGIAASRVSRVWWRTFDNNLALVNELFRNNDNFGNYLGSIKELIYCVNSNPNNIDNNLEVLNNIKHQGIELVYTLKIPFVYKYNNNISDKYIFKYPNSEVNLNFYYDIKLNPEIDFINLCENFDLENIYYTNSNLRSLDVNLNLLNKLSIYHLENGELYKIDSDFIMSETYKLDKNRSYNGLLYNKSELGIPDIKYEVLGTDSGHKFAYLEYNNVILINISKYNLLSYEQYSQDYNSYDSEPITTLKADLKEEFDRQNIDLNI